MTEPHRIRLLRPWGLRVVEGGPEGRDLLEFDKLQLPVSFYEILTSLLDTARTPTSVDFVFSRGFHRPNGLIESSRVFLVIEGLFPAVSVQINDDDRSINNPLILENSPAAAVRTDITRQLVAGHNRLSLHFPVIQPPPGSPAENGLKSVYLEIFEVQ